MLGNLAKHLAPWWWRIILIICAVLLSGGGGLYLLTGRSPAAAASKLTSAVGDWEPVKRGNFEILCREEGELRAVKVTTLTFLRWGKISFLVPEGSVVKKGDKLVSLETKDLEEEVQRNEEDRAAAERDLAQREQTRDLETKRLNTELASEREKAALAALRERELLALPLPLDKIEAE
ncbi:MAG: hypothetical protein ABSE73_11605, partial [Planctomycetota bacterium]